MTNSDPLLAWVGRTETRVDQVTPTPVAALAATLDRGDLPPASGDSLPPLWHWLYFLPLARQSEIGRDGHPQRGGFLPPVPLAAANVGGRPLRFPAAIARRRAHRAHVAVSPTSRRRKDARVRSCSCSYAMRSR
jgi:3-methylfumaryl-CoA hydratase